MRKCIGCGDCCGHYLPLTEDEIREILAYVTEHGIRPNPSELSCPWLARNRTCAIYRVRPSICKGYHCDPRLARRMDGDRSDYHVYNTMRLFTEADMTTYDGIEQLVSGLGTPYTDAFFGGRG